MKTVTKLSAIPEKSVVLNGFGKVDYHDTYQIQKETAQSAEEIANQMMPLPGWATALFKLRNVIADMFGLKADKADVPFPVISKSDDEIVVGLSDKHLDFRTAIMADRIGNNVSLITVVHFNNAWGRVYFSLVKPFHKIIMKTLLKRYLNKNTEDDEH